MSLTASRFKDTILRECNLQHDPESSDLVELWWDMYPDKADRVRYFYAKYHALEYLEGLYREEVDLQTGADRVSAGQKHTHVERQLARLEVRIRQLDPGGFVPKLKVASANPTMKGRLVPYSLRQEPLAVADATEILPKMDDYFNPSI